MRFFNILFFLCFCFGARANAIVEINEKNFETVVGEDRHAFLLFTAPSCENCTVMNSLWEKFSKNYIDHYKVFFGKVECSPESDFCRAKKIKSFPSIHYFSVESKDAEEYIGEKNEEKIKLFIDENLAPQCGFERLELCNEKQKIWMDKNFHIPPEELNILIETREAEFDKITQSFNKYVEDLNKKYQETHQKYIELMSGTHKDLKWFRSVRKELFGTSNDEL